MASRLGTPRGRTRLKTPMSRGMSSHMTTTVRRYREEKGTGE